MYLNSRGCVIPKDSIDKDELNRIRSELTVIPKENHAMKIAQQQEKQIVVFRENEQKIYIPRFYGIENYGDPETIDIPCGDNIIVPFVN